MKSMEATVSKQNQPQLPDAQQAFATLFNNVHQQVFFHKLAEVYGIAPQNEAQQAAMLEGAFRLRQLEEDEAYKQASAGGPGGYDDDPFVAANRHLASLTGEADYVKEAHETEAIAGMAAQLMQQPEFYNSVLSLKAKQAADLARAQG